MVIGRRMVMNFNVALCYIEQQRMRKMFGWVWCVGSIYLDMGPTQQPRLGPTKRTREFVSIIM